MPNPIVTKMARSIKGNLSVDGGRIIISAEDEGELELAKLVSMFDGRDVTINIASNEEGFVNKE